MGHYDDCYEYDKQKNYEADKPRREKKALLIQRLCKKLGITVEEFSTLRSLIRDKHDD